MVAKKQTFEASMTALEEIVRKLEQGDASLEEAIALYQQGMTSSKQCHEQLQVAEQQLVAVVNEDGTTQPFATDGEN